MNSRIRELREYLHLTLEAFGARIGVTRSAISNIENGRRDPTNQLILSICREFRVSEEWLRTGCGEMFPPATRAQEIAAWADELMKDSPESTRFAFISYLMEWDVEDWEAIARILKKHGFPKAKKEEEPAL